MTSAARARELLGGAADRGRMWISYATRAPAHRRRSFTFAGQTYRYHAAVYNRTWTNERTVELPIVIRAIAERPDARVLEVGNVLAHYGVSGHMVIDKYETASVVLNQDILDFEDGNGFDLVVSISTLEHTGFEEEVDEPEKPSRVAAHLGRLLRPGGRAIVTFPLGYNPGLDTLVRERPEAFGQMRGLRRISADNRWTEAAVPDLLGASYGSPFPSANALVVASIPAHMPSGDDQAQTARQ
jgi:SAM-dependent methyltransferase